MTLKRRETVDLFFSLVESIPAGEKMDKQDWDLEKIVLPIRQLVKDFDLTWPGREPINQDLALADRVFQAAKSLLVQSGIYVVEKGRRLTLTESMVEQGLEAMPQALTMGSGEEAVTLRPRALEDSARPLVCAGNPGAPIPEAIFLPMLVGWMREPNVDAATCGSLSQAQGMPEVPGAFAEILLTRRELALIDQARQQAGRPGLGVLGAQSSMTHLGDLAVVNTAELRPCDAHLVPLLNELMVDVGSLIRVVNSLNRRVLNASLATVMVGGLGGGPAGSALLQTASLMAANLIGLADYHLVHPIHIRHVATSTREVLWVQSVVGQAFARNAPAILFADIYPKSGAGTPELLYETAASALTASVSGMHLEGVGAADGALPNASPLEVRLMADVGRRAAEKGINLAAANRMVTALLEKYERVFDQPGGNPGQPFDQVCDTQTLDPSPDWLAVDEDVRRELVGLGVL